LRWLICALSLFACAQAAELSYDLDITLTEAGALTGMARVTGHAASAWPEAVFRCYPAAGSPEYLHPTKAVVGSEEVAWDSVHPTVFVVPLGAEADQTFSVTLEYQGFIPWLEDQDGYGTFARSARCLVASQAYPMLAPWEGGWVVEPIFPWGDAVVAEVADYSAHVTLPQGWDVVATGEEEGLPSSEYRVTGTNLREFALVALKGYAVTEVHAEGVRVRSFFLPEHEAGGAAALEFTVEALSIYADLFGPYPFSELDIVEVPLRNAAGVEYPGLILAGSQYYAAYPNDPLFFPMIFAHEVAHQWWYAQVGNDQVAEPWLDEALATYTSGLFFEQRGDLQKILSYWEDSYARGRQRNPEATVSTPLWDFPGGAGYGGIVYSGGALFLHEVRGRMGDEAFFQALRRYIGEYRWEIAHGEDLLRILRAESPLPLDDLIRKWLGLSYTHEVALPTCAP